MPGDSPVIELVKLPGPVPLVVLDPAIVGSGVVLQHTPRAVTLAPPSFVIFPPLVAEVEVIDDASAVVSTGRIAAVVADTWFPYAVPTLFLA